MKICSLVKTAGVLLLATLGVSACNILTFDEAASDFNENAGAGSPPTGSPPPPPPPPPPAGASFGPTFSEIQAGLFDDCSSACHSGANPPGGLDLSVNASYMMLVGTPSSADPNVERVAPGQPGSSYLVQKLEGVNGDPPHPAGSEVPQPDIDSIRAWIADGAIDDTAAPPAVPVQVTSMSPAPGANLSAAPMTITIGFTKVLDASTVNSMTLELVGAGGDGQFTDGNEVTVSATAISVPSANPQSVVFDVSGTMLGDDTYRFVIRGNGGNVVLDTEALVLDGEYFGGFPTGNGTAGGDFVTTFTVGTAAGLEPNLNSIQDLVFSPTCATSGCHAGAMPSAELDLSDAMTSYTELVGVESTRLAGRMLVTAGDSANSYLIEKLGPNPSAGQQMPPGGRPALPDSDIDGIRQWIDSGAAPP
jgi:hypothetical protein